MVMNATSQGMGRMNVKGKNIHILNMNRREMAAEK